MKYFLMTVLLLGSYNLVSSREHMHQVQVADFKFEDLPEDLHFHCFAANAANVFYGVDYYGSPFLVIDSHINGETIRVNKVFSKEQRTCYTAFEGFVTIEVIESQTEVIVRFLGRKPDRRTKNIVTITLDLFKGRKLPVNTVPIKSCRIERSKFVSHR